jgi:aryl-alcohol dehydrogenase-like predicted oxidoreductase
MAELILGTASLSPGYGISRANQEISTQESKRLIQTAQSLGINRFDTAPVYGLAEEILGIALNKHQELRISTKIGPSACQNIGILKDSIDTSLAKLKISRIDTLYIHDERVLLDGNGANVIRNLESLKSSGVYSKLGVSVYRLESLFEIIKKFPSIKVFQVPENICDRRIQESEPFAKLQKGELEFVVRSVFMQGLLLMNPEDIPVKLSGASKAIESLILTARLNALSVLDLCMAYVRSISWCSGILVGVMSPLQLMEIANSNAQLPKNWQKKVLKIPNEVIDPRKWDLSK